MRVQCVNKQLPLNSGLTLIEAIVSIVILGVAFSMSLKIGYLLIKASSSSQQASDIQLLKRCIYEFERTREYIHFTEADTVYEETFYIYPTNVNHYKSYVIQPLGIEALEPPQYQLSVKYEQIKDASLTFAKGSQISVQMIVNPMSANAVSEEVTCELVVFKCLDFNINDHISK